MRVEQSQQAETVTARSGLVSSTSTKAPRTAFASVLAKSTTETGHGTGGSNTVDEPKKPGKHSKAETGELRPIPKGPKGEITQAVPDHPAFIEVTSGPRNGLFINVTSNERRGEAFALLKRDDRDLHIYGTGKDRRVIISWHKDQPAHRHEYNADGSKKSAKEIEAAKHAAPDTGGIAAP